MTVAPAEAYPPTKHEVVALIRPLVLKGSAGFSIHDTADDDFFLFLSLVGWWWLCDDASRRTLFQAILHCASRTDAATITMYVWAGLQPQPAKLSDLQYNQQL